MNHNKIRRLHHEERLQVRLTCRDRHWRPGAERPFPPAAFARASTSCRMLLLSADVPHPRGR